MAIIRIERTFRSKKITEDSIDKRIFSPIVKKMKRAGREIQEKYESTVYNWGTHGREVRDLPEFIFELKNLVSTDEVQVIVSTDNLLYKYLDGGTSKRYAYLSGNWSSITSPNSLTTNPGKGKAYPTNIPYPGITARNFTKNILEGMKKDYYNGVNVVFKDGISKLRFVSEL